MFVPHILKDLCRIKPSPPEAYSPALLIDPSYLTAGVLAHNNTAPTIRVFAINAIPDSWSYTTVELNVITPPQSQFELSEVFLARCYTPHSNQNSRLNIYTTLL